MNRLDKSYQDLLQDILENGVSKGDRTGTGTISVFGRQLHHKMNTGFPLLTTKRMAWKTMVAELLWFLRGDTNIKYLVDNGCHIWDGDAFKAYVRKNNIDFSHVLPENMTLAYEDKKREFVENIKASEAFAKQWGNLGPIYGKQWRGWGSHVQYVSTRHGEEVVHHKGVDQIKNLIDDLKSNPDSRRLMVNAWNVEQIDKMTLPPCHYGFQLYTRDLTWEEKVQWVMKNTDVELENLYIVEEASKETTPTRAISLMWNQRSCDTFLGIPFNIASYGLLLEIIAKIVNMVPDELIGQLGDTHLYSNHTSQALEQINREPFDLPKIEFSEKFYKNIDKYTGKFKINDTVDFGFYKNLDAVINNLDIDDFLIRDYISHPAIKAPLSN